MFHFFKPTFHPFRTVRSISPSRTATQCRNSMHEWLPLTPKFPPSQTTKFGRPRRTSSPTHLVANGTLFLCLQVTIPFPGARLSSKVGQDRVCRPDGVGSPPSTHLNLVAADPVTSRPVTLFRLFFVRVGNATTLSRRLDSPLSRRLTPRLVAIVSASRKFYPFILAPPPPPRPPPTLLSNLFRWPPFFFFFFFLEP